jgi:putative flippase GtrA
MSPEAYSLPRIGQLGRYTLTGGLNTLIGFAVIVGLLSAGFSDVTANAIGFGIGLLISFFVNRSWTFGQITKPKTQEVVLFVISFCLAYAVNLLIILSGKAFGFGGSWLLHLAGVFSYAGCFYLLSKTLIYGTDTQNFSQGLIRYLHRNWPSFGILTIVACSAPLLFQLPLTHDVSWQFWIARQMANGVPIYERIMEINPPLWFWMAVPLHVLGTEIGIQPDRLYIAAIMLVSAWSSLIVGRLLFESEAKRQFGAMVAILVFFWVAPLYDFGQREQLSLILALPYCALIFKRVQNEDVTSRVVVAISIMAAAGFALKHYFVLVPLLLETWYFLYHRKLLNIVRTETVILGASAFIYIAAILYYTPDFVSKIIPLVASSYGGYEKGLIAQLIRVEVLVWLCAVVTFFSLRKTLENRDKQIGDMLAISAVGYAASYFLQQKGWQYHAIPGAACASLMLIHYLSSQREPVKVMASNPLAMIGAIVFLTTGLGRGTYHSDWADDMPKYLSTTSPGESVMIFTADPRRVFPFIDDYRLIWPSRHFAHWMLAAIVRAEANPPKFMTPELAKVAFDIRQQAYDDIICHPPAVILSHIRNRGGTVSPETFRMTDFFRRNTSLNQYMEKNYRLAFRDSTFEVYRRKTPTHPRPAGCYPVYAAG